ncbi:MAG: sensor protein [Anaerolineaceae bacterium]|nr:MAG: sensor protein [Anaerolineaceae bacterium]
MSRLSIRTKMMIVFMSLSAVVLAGVFTWFYQSATARAMDSLRESLVTAAVTAAGLVDPAEHEQVYATGVEDTPQYTHIAEQLRLVRDANDNIDSIYTAALSSNPNEVIFVVDSEESTADTEDTSGRVSLGEIYDASNAPQMMKAFDGQPTADVNIVSDADGDYLSGYAPILDASGEVVAIVGVDMHVDDILLVQAQIRNVSLLAFVISLAAVFAAVYLLSGAITKPLRAITGAAQALEQDEPFEPERLERVARGTDELGQLARVFSRMAVQVQERQKKLREEVTQLKIEIDEARRQKQVDEIAGSEFFKDLKDKAREMRKRTDDK